VTIVAIVLAAALVVVVVVFVRYQTARDQRFAEVERAYVLERRELLNRIQRPDMIPVRAPDAFVQPESEPDQIDLVGVIMEPPGEEE